MNERVVLITGAAYGLGRALADLYLAKGWWVIATDYLWIITILKEKR